MRGLVCLPGLLLCALLPLPCAAAGIAAQVDRLLADSPQIRLGFWGAAIVEVESGRVLFQRNSNSYFVPASNMKLLTTALALTRLGPDHRFHTRVLAAAGPDANGTVDGDLVLVGGGDPSLSGRPMPYDAAAPFGDPLAALDELARQVYGRGVRRIKGDVVGDDSAYLREPYPDGWAQDDGVWEYGAAVSALSVNDNTIRMRVRPGTRPGGAARVWFDPPLDYFTVHNRLLSTASGARKIYLDRKHGSRTIELWGTVPVRAPGASYLLAVGEPAHFAATAFRQALLRQGIVVEGGVAARHSYPGMGYPSKQSPAGGAETVELAARTSPPLAQIIQVVNKVSQNLHAELLLREVARRRRPEASRQAGIEELKAFLREAGYAPEKARLEDGSGLSRLNLLTPSLLTRLLLHMHASPHRQAWLDSLPVGGKDGTLRPRFRKQGGEQVLAKTGTISHVSTLSGYATGAGGRLVAFSIMVNNVNAGSAVLRDFVDKIVLLVTQ